MTETVHKVKASTQYKREHKKDYGKEKITILYEDNDIVVISKPTGLLSVPYPGSKSRTAVELLEKIMRSKGTLSSAHHPCVVHRLDRDTSGVMIFALNEAAQKKLMNHWHKVVSERLYVAVAENPKDKRKELPLSGVIDDALAKNAYNVGYVPNKKDDNAKTVAARTHYKILLRGKTHTMFQLELDTGKKNQIRAHLSSKGYPLCGDENYRAKTDPFHRLALHAKSIEFIHPSTGEKLRFEESEPAEWKAYVEKGDEHSEIPVWEKDKMKRAKPKESKVSFVKDLPSNKKCRKMDYIQRGKNFSK